MQEPNTQETVQLDTMGKAGHQEIQEEQDFIFQGPPLSDLGGRWIYSLTALVVMEVDMLDTSKSQISAIHWISIKL